MLMRISSLCCATLLSSTLVAAHAPAAVFRGNGHGYSHHPQPIRVQPIRNHGHGYGHGHSHGYNHGHGHGQVWIAGTWILRGCTRVYVPGYWTTAACPPAPCASPARSRVSVTWRW